MEGKQLWYKQGHSLFQWGPIWIHFTSYNAKPRGICHTVTTNCVAGFRDLGLSRLDRNPVICRLNLDTGNHFVKQGLSSPVWTCAGCEFYSLQQTVATVTGCYDKRRRGGGGGGGGGEFLTNFCCQLSVGWQSNLHW